MLFAVTPLPWLRQALRTTATPRFWVRFEKACPRHAVAPLAARGGAHVLLGEEPSAPQVAARPLRGGAGARVPNKTANDVAIIQTPSLSGLRLNTKCAMLATDDTMMNAWFAIELVCRLRWFSLGLSLVVGPCSCVVCSFCLSRWR